ncbi:hypothetical protein [Novipirellula aureliae]|uniref:hypothetical protein n=1 Tax=Novipirellula aureliae TaxID=2527966 RepID=UPI0011B7A14B|nr:hypothetical protein [Novipirellula aureliae]
MFFKSLCTSLILIVSLTALVGCQRVTLDRVDTAKAEFSSVEDYAAYDHEMETLSKGQPE